MKKDPIFVRALTLEEKQQLRTGLRSAEAFTMRRCQILLLSCEVQTPRQKPGSFTVQQANDALATPKSKP